jgi:uncharacterized protein (DUF2235 family)
MTRQLVVCCDGTWNTPDEKRAGVAAPTNVAKLALGVVSDADAGQLLFYEPGVGTSPDKHLLGGAFGYGLSANVRSGYRFLAENYQPGDNIFLFGFSRGAYTARSLAGLIRNCGILLPAHVDRVDEAFAFYRDRTSQTHPVAVASQLFRRMYSHPDDTIHFIGVWDTVGSLGIPDTLPGWEEVAKLFPGWEQLWGFHDTQLSSHVRHACHALAIDEQRVAFKPTLWTQDPNPGEQTLEQVWFAGVHTEVGGGSRDASLSDIALLWMVEKAKACGLLVTPGQLEVGSPDGVGQAIAPSYAGPIADSRSGLWSIMHAYHRLSELPFDGAPGQLMASSVVRRHDERVGGYAPPGLDDYLRALAPTPVVEAV